MKVGRIFGSNAHNTVRNNVRGPPNNTRPVYILALNPSLSPLTTSPREPFPVYWDSYTHTDHLNIRTLTHFYRGAKFGPHTYTPSLTLSPLWVKVNRSVSHDYKPYVDKCIGPPFLLQGLRHDASGLAYGRRATRQRMDVSIYILSYQCAKVFDIYTCIYTFLTLLLISRFKIINKDSKIYSYYELNNINISATTFDEIQMLCLHICLCMNFIYETWNMRSIHVNNSM